MRRDGTSPKPVRRRLFSSPDAARASRQKGRERRGSAHSGDRRNRRARRHRSVVTADAVLYPINQANVTPKISAPVKRVLVNRGDHVKAGQVLAELESRDLAAAASEAKPVSSRRRPRIKPYRRDRSRRSDQSPGRRQAAQQTLEAAKKLYDNRVASAETRRTRAETRRRRQGRDGPGAEPARNGAAPSGGPESSQPARNDPRRASAVNAAKAHYESAAVQLSYAQIRSPISGIVADRPVYPRRNGRQRIADDFHRRHLAGRGARQYSGEGSQLDPRRAARRASPDPMAISPAKSPSSAPRSIPAPPPSKSGCRLPNPGEKLKPGATVRVAIIAETIQNTHRRSRLGAAQFRRRRPKGHGRDQRFRSRTSAESSVGVRQGTRVQILTGLKEGEQVVTSGGLGLEDKAKVAIQSEARRRRRRRRRRRQRSPTSKGQEAMIEHSNSRALDRALLAPHHLRHPHADRRRRLSGLHHSRRRFPLHRFPAHRGRHRQRRGAHQSDGGHRHAPRRRGHEQRARPRIR